MRIDQYQRIVFLHSETERYHLDVRLEGHLQVQGVIHLLLTFLLSAASERAAALKVGVTIATGSDVRGSLVVAQIDDGGHQAAARILGDCGAPACEVELPVGHWLVQWKAPAWWSPVQPVEIAEGKNRIDLQAFPTATVSGQIVTEKGDTLAKNSMRIHFHSIDGAIEDERGCVIEDARFTCEIPSGTYDLRIRTTGHISHHLWAVAATPHQAIDIGPRTFRLGSSLVGTVHLAPDVKAALTRLNVILTPAGAERLRDIQKLSGLTLTVRPNEKGFFAFEGIAPGEYDLSAAARGLFSQRVKVDILPGKEAELSAPLVVDRPETIRVSLTPPLDPWGAKWTIEMEQERDEGRERATVTQSSADSNGHWESSRIASEPYRLVVLDHGTHQWFDQEITPHGPSEISILVPVSRVHGTVNLGDRPLGPAILKFDGGYASIPIAADEGGGFNGYLPEALQTSWRVNIDCKSLMVTRQLENVHFRIDSNAEATLDLKVPSTHLGGTVVDARHEPIDQALVSVRGPSGEFVQTAAVHGTFVVNGLPAGSYTLRAETFDHGESDAVTAEVAEDGSQGDVELMLRRNDQLAITLVSDTGPVAGATVWSIPTDIKTLIVFPLNTDAAGELRRPIPAGAREFDFVIETPGFATRIFHHRLLGEDLRVRVNQLGGSLTLSYPSPGTENGKVPLLLHDGAVVAPHLLGTPTCGEHCSLSLIADSGEYLLCEVTPAAIDSLRSTARPDACVRGFLSMGGALRLAQ
jgi:hypothetical protein